MDKRGWIRLKKEKLISSGLCWVGNDLVIGPKCVENVLSFCQIMYIQLQKLQNPYQLTFNISSINIVFSF